MTTLCDIRGAHERVFEATRGFKDASATRPRVSRFLANFKNAKTRSRLSGAPTTTPATMVRFVCRSRCSSDWDTRVRGKKRGTPGRRTAATFIRNPNLSSPSLKLAYPSVASCASSSIACCRRLFWFAQSPPPAYAPPAAAAALPSAPAGFAVHVPLGAPPRVTTERGLATHRVCAFGVRVDLCVRRNHERTASRPAVRFHKPRPLEPTRDPRLTPNAHAPKPRPRNKPSRARL